MIICLIVVWLIVWNWVEIWNFLKAEWEGIKGLSQNFHSAFDPHEFEFFQHKP